MASPLSSRINPCCLTESVNRLYTFKVEVRNFRTLIQEIGDTSLELCFVTSILDACKKMNHITKMAIFLSRSKYYFIRKMTTLEDIQKKLEETIKQADISIGSLTENGHENAKDTKEKETEANNNTEEKPPEESHEGKKNEGDSTSVAKLPLEDSKGQDTNSGEGKILKEKEVEDF